MNNTFTYPLTLLFDNGVNSLKEDNFDGESTRLRIKGITDICFTDLKPVVYFTSQQAMMLAHQLTGWKIYSQEQFFALAMDCIIDEHKQIWIYCLNDTKNYRQGSYYRTWSIEPENIPTQPQSGQKSKCPTFSWTGFSVYLLSYLGGSATMKIKHYAQKRFAVLKRYLDARKSEYVQMKRDD